MIWEHSTTHRIEDRTRRAMRRRENLQTRTKTPRLIRNDVEALQSIANRLRCKIKESSRNNHIKHTFKLYSGSIKGLTSGTISVALYNPKGN
jgi:hypothetical protein